MNITKNILNPPTCLACGKSIQQDDPFCRYCGRKAGKKASWYHQTWGIVILLFLVLGPLAIPLLWRSPVLSQKKKVALTFLCVAYSAFLGWLMIQSYVNLLDEITESMPHYRNL